VAASLVLPAPSYAADTCSGSSSVEVDVVGSIHTSQSFSPQQICNLYDTFGAKYQIRSRPGGPTNGTDPTPQVLSIQGLLTSVQVGSGSTLPLSRVTFVQVIDSGGHPHGLDQQQVGDPGSVFPGGLVPAVWWQASTGQAGSDEMFYIRPLMGPNDVNAVDYFGTNPGQPLQVVAHTTGALLHPSISATPATAEAGQPVSFSVSFADPQPTTRLHYFWSFGDGTTGTGAAPRHTFKTSCICGVRLDVTGSDTSSGSSAITLQVGSPPKQTGGPHPTSGPSDPTPSGPHEGGPTSGPTSLAPTPTATPTATPSATPSATRAGSVSGPAGTPGGGPTQGANAGPTSGPSAGGRDASHSNEVAGRLLLASQVYAVPKDTVQASQAASARAPGRLNRSWWWTASLLIPLLIGLGVVGESLQLRRRLARMTT